MRAALVERCGYGLTHAAWDRGIDGLCLNIVTFAHVLLFLLLLMSGLQSFL